MLSAPISSQYVREKFTWIILFIACVLFAGCEPTDKGAASKTTDKETKWNELIPAGWDSGQAFKGLNFGSLKDADPRATEALQRLREAWDNAPIQSALNGVSIRIPGFVVPLERNGNQLTEFLLAPYFGACIHTPPPPANQIIHVFPLTPLKETGRAEPVWVSGVLETVYSETGMGKAGYRIKGAVVAAY
jgi:uncharacterized protein